MLSSTRKNSEKRLSEEEEARLEVGVELMFASSVGEEGSTPQ